MLHFVLVIVVVSVIDRLSLHAALRLLPHEGRPCHLPQLAGATVALLSNWHSHPFAASESCTGGEGKVFAEQVCLHGRLGFDVVKDAMFETLIVHNCSPAS